MEKILLFKNWSQNSGKGEVFTPSYLVNEMLDEIPEVIWKNPTSKFCDLSMGKGTFLLEIVNRLVYIYGYSEDDAKSRVFGYEIRLKYVNYLKRRGFVNVSHKDSLEEKFNMKFDAVVGNPPYQELDDNGKPKGGGKGGGNNLWSKFFIKAKEISDNVFFIHPPSFLSPNHIVLEKMYEDGGLKFLKIYDKSPFEGVSTQACYYNWHRGYNGLCKVGGENVNLNNGVLPNSSNPLDFSIFNKFFNTNSFNFTSNSKLHKSNKKHLLNDDYNDVFCYKTHHGSKVIYSSIQTDLFSKDKVVISDSGYLNPMFCNESNTTQHSFYMLVNNISEGTNLVNILKSKLYDYCLKKSKFSGFFHGEVLKNIPRVDLTVEWSDQELYEYFKITEEEILHIENNVK
jgi:site-specific DNA-methyltransferase (adenine-specific)